MVGLTAVMAKELVFEGSIGTAKETNALKARRGMAGSQARRQIPADL